MGRAPALRLGLGALLTLRSALVDIVVLRQEYLGVVRTAIKLLDVQFEETGELRGELLRVVRKGVCTVLGHRVRVLEIQNPLQLAELVLLVLVAAMACLCVLAQLAGLRDLRIDSRLAFNLVPAVLRFPPSILLPRIYLKLLETGGAEVPGPDKGQLLPLGSGVVSCAGHLAGRCAVRLLLFVHFRLPQKFNQIPIAVISRLLVQSGPRANFTHVLLQHFVNVDLLFNVVVLEKLIEVGVQLHGQHFFLLATLGFVQVQLLRPTTL